MKTSVHVVHYVVNEPTLTLHLDHDTHDSTRDETRTFEGPNPEPLTSLTIFIRLSPFTILTSDQGQTQTNNTRGPVVYQDIFLVTWFRVLVQDPDRDVQGGGTGRGSIVRESIYSTLT